MYETSQQAARKRAKDLRIDRYLTNSPASRAYAGRAGRLHNNALIHQLNERARQNNAQPSDLAGH